MATRSTLTQWLDRLQSETGDGFPVKKTGLVPSTSWSHGLRRNDTKDYCASIEKGVYNAPNPRRGFRRKT